MSLFHSRSQVRCIFSKVKMLSISISFPKFCFGRWRGAQHLCWTLPITQKLLCKGTLVTSSQESPSISRWRRGSTPTHQHQLWKKIQILEWQLLTLTINHCLSKQCQAWKASPKSFFFFVENDLQTHCSPWELHPWKPQTPKTAPLGEAAPPGSDEWRTLISAPDWQNFTSLTANSSQKSILCPSGNWNSFFFSFTEQVLDCSIGLGVFLGLGWVFFVWLFTFPINICQCLLFPQRSLPWGSAAKLHSYSDLHWSPLN